MENISRQEHTNARQPSARRERLRDSMFSVFFDKGMRREVPPMPSLRLATAIVALLALTACVDSGPPTAAQIDQDIQADLWTSNQLPPVVPGTAPPIATGDESERVIP